MRGGGGNRYPCYDRLSEAKRPGKVHPLQRPLPSHEIRDRHHVHVWDALLAAIESGIDTIITEEAHLRRIPGITVANPCR